MNLDDKTELYLFRMWLVDGEFLFKAEHIQALHDWLKETFQDDHYTVNWDPEIQFYDGLEPVPNAASVWVRGHGNAVLFKLRWHDDIAFHVFDKELKLYK
jgi:hypothetical protein